jgi:hypothetical protein
MLETDVVTPVETDAASSPAEVETQVTETEPEGSEVETETQPDSATRTEESADKESPQNAKDKEEDLGEWSGSAGAKLRELTKLAPELNAVLAKYPNVKNEIAGAFRRSAAIRELGTIAEIRELRDHFPRGVEDAKQVLAELEDYGQLDNAFYGKDRDGNYTGHANFIKERLWSNDPAATVSLLKTVPKQWAELDPASYNEVFGSIMASTFSQDRILDTIADAYNREKTAGNADAAKSLAHVWNYLDKFGKKPDADNPEAQRLARERAEFNRTRSQSQVADQQRFHNSFMADSMKMQKELIAKHPDISKLPEAIPEAKKARIVEEIRSRIVKHLQKSHSFMNSLGPAYEAQDLKRTQDIQRSAWSQAWLLNKYVREVLAEETPSIVQGNRAVNGAKKAAAARTGLSTQRQNGQPKPAGQPPKKKLSDFTTQEIVAGMADDLIH